MDIVTGTLGKALGGASGGYTAAHAEIVEMLRQRSRPYLFSNSVAPSIVAAGLATLDLLETSGELLDRLRDNTAYFRAEMTERGFDIPESDHPIVPVMIGDAAEAGAMADRLLEEGIYVRAFSLPGGAPGQGADPYPDVGRPLPRRPGPGHRRVREGPLNSNLAEPR